MLCETTRVKTNFGVLRLRMNLTTLEIGMPLWLSVRSTYEIDGMQKRSCQSSRKLARRFLRERIQLITNGGGV